jgi:hypothetical protein
MVNLWNLAPRSCLYFLSETLVLVPHINENKNPIPGLVLKKNVYSRSDSKIGSKNQTWYS